MGTPLGQDVGYAVRFENVCTPGTTKIQFCTDGVLLRELMDDPLLTKYGVVMVDEAHERSLATDALLGLLKKIQRRRPDLRVVVASATIQAETFADFFDTRHVELKPALGPAALAPAARVPSREPGIVSVDVPGVTPPGEVEAVEREGDVIGGLLRHPAEAQERRAEPLPPGQRRRGALGVHHALREFPEGAPQAQGQPREAPAAAVVALEGDVPGARARVPPLAREGARDPPARAERGPEREKSANFRGSALGRCPLVSADFSTSGDLSGRSRSGDAFFGTRARGTLTLTRT